MCPAYLCGLDYPLAQMKSADRSPNHLCALFVRLVPSGLFDPRSDRFVISSQHPAYLLDDDSVVKAS